jgi:DNA-binding transcriptional LysR family regulator
MFDPWQLRTIAELARRGTMTAVAERLALTPSAVSQQLARLEQQAGVALFEPDGRRVRLTPAGLLLAQRAETILGALQDAAEEVASLDRDAFGVLRIASFPTAAAALCPSVISGFAARHPRHHVTLVESEPAVGIGAVLAGDVDLAVVDEPALPVAGRDTSLAYEELYADPLYVVMRPDHRLAGRRNIDLRSLAAEAWVMDLPTCSFYRLTVDLCQEAGFRPNVIANTESVRVSSALVRVGAGVAILPGLALAQVADLVFRPLAPPVVRRLYAAYRARATDRPSIATALELFREAAEAVGQSVRRSVPR